MVQFTRDDLRTLFDEIHEQIGPNVTIMFPTTRTRNDNQESVIRLKNLARQAHDQLAAMGVDRPDIEMMLAPVQTLIDSDDFGAGPDGGMMLFLGTKPDDFRYYHLPMPVEEKVIVAERFHIKPMLPALMNNERFFVLTLSQNRAQLFEGTREGLTPREVPNMPANRDEATQMQGEGRNEGVFAVGNSGRPDAPGTQTGIGGQTTSFAGHGAGDVDMTPQIQQYFHKVNDALHPILRNENIPLVVVAVDYLHPLYKNANTYKHLTEQGVLGNPERYTHKDLLERTWEVVAPLFRQREQDYKQRYADLRHLKQSSNVPLEILQSAYMGQIDVLFVAQGEEMWGTYDFATNKLEVHTEQRPGDADLFDLAATQVILNAGTVYVLPREEMPDGVQVAAVYRYSLAS
jgi:hypothetical protein